MFLVLNVMSEESGGFRADGGRKLGGARGRA
ncbi:hypothetical protein O166_22475 [Pseudogulbenkiania ferrooxidans EGD-HP2]|uniref:Uncharacterized protein n=1 Tax=Pseudogulbenkiania ferrooxidans EGD-HP2 TaxID=1388764 RepID=A0ABP2XRC4_9NEIS|nr:hypothetical protein O166_22475 [Pseudogulbenkiania ferrooxidans EGD-HP2]